MRLANIFEIVTGLIFGLIVLATLVSFVYKWWLRTRFWIRHGRRGKTVLFVYSDSPNWKAYIESNILPCIADKAVTLNWSERKRWGEEHPFEAKVFRRWAGHREFNPVAIVFSPKGKVKVIRFWQAFRDYKHGKVQPLKRAEGELLNAVTEHPAKAA